MADDAEDSVLNDELTLPIDWEKSGRMSLLGNLTNSDDTLLEERKNLKVTPQFQPYSSMPDLNAFRAVSRSAGAGGDHRVTPSSSTDARPLSLKEYEQQLNDLKKENFNLKLRIYFLESKLPKVDGLSGEDLMKKNLTLQVELETVKTEFERKEKENANRLKNMQASLMNEVDEANDAREKDRQELIRCSSHLSALRRQFEDIAKSLVDAQSENRKLKNFMDARADKPILSESDSEVSLLSEQERIIMNLKRRVCQFEQEMADQRDKYDEDLRELQTQLAIAKNSIKPPKPALSAASQTEMIEQDKHAKSATTSDLFHGQNVSANQMNRLNNYTVVVMQQHQEFENNGRFDYTGFETGIIVPPNDIEEKVYDLQKQVDEKVASINALNDQLMADRLKLEKKMEEFDRVSEKLKLERENGLKRDKTIQGLLKTIENERKLTKRMDDHDASSFVDMSHVTDPSLLFPRSNGPNNPPLYDLDEENQRIIEHLKEKLTRMEKVRGNLYDRIRRVAEILLQLAEKFGGDTADVLLALSADLSKFNDDEMELGEISAFVKNANFHTSMIDDKDMVDELNQYERSLAALIKPLKKSSSIDKLNCADVLSELEKIQNVLLNVARYLSRKSSPSASTPVDSADAFVQVHFEDEMVKSLQRKNEKLERYAKSVKGSYRKLETKILQDRQKTENAKTAVDEFKKKALTDLDDQFEVLLDDEETENCRLEGIVRQLEENNRILAERLMEHERKDDGLKQDAAKMRVLQKKVENFERKLGGGARRVASEKAKE